MTYIYRPGAYNVTDARRARIAQPGGAAVALHIEDSFNAPSNTLINGRFPDVANTPGNAWANVLGTWKIITNAARGTDYLFGIVTIDALAANGIITMPSQRGGNRNGIVFRYVDANNYWLAETTSTACGFRILEVTGGVGTTRAFNLNTDLTTLTLTVTLNGNAITANWNGITLNYNSAQHGAATRHGIARQDYQYSGGVANWWKMVSL